jgi:thiol-disulfide isomerase/thioredoxin
MSKSFTPKSKPKKKSSRASLVVTITIIAIVAIVAIFLDIAAHKTAPKPFKVASEASGVLQPAYDVPISTLKSANTLAAVSVGYPIKLAPNPLSSSPITHKSTPDIFYYGAQWCPYCAAQRWPLMVALSEFGTFKNIALGASSPTDVYPLTPTISFSESTYHSKYVNFVPIEFQNVSHQTLQVPNPTEASILAKYDASTYTHIGTGGIPFVLFSNKYVSAGAYYNPQLLAGATQKQIAKEIAHPKTIVGESIDKAAYGIVKSICSITHNADTAVCAQVS